MWELDVEDYEILLLLASKVYNTQTVERNLHNKQDVNLFKNLQRNNFRMKYHKEAAMKITNEKILLTLNAEIFVFNSLTLIFWFTPYP